VVEAGAPAALRARGGAYARLLAAADGDRLDAPSPGPDVADDVASAMTGTARA
jgi:hypothetical protein